MPRQFPRAQASSLDPEIMHPCKKDGRLLACLKQKHDEPDKVPEGKNSVTFWSFEKNRAAHMQETKSCRHKAACNNQPELSN